jgi:hypothetical protein
MTKHRYFAGSIMSKTRIVRWFPAPVVASRDFAERK